MSKRLLDKLEQYEKDAYAGGYGQDWLEDLGEGFKFYIAKCIAENKRATISGFERHIDELHKKAEGLVFE